MCKFARNLLAGLALVGCLALPFAASAVTYEDSFANCNYPKTFDLVVMRPLSFFALMFGTIFYVPLAPLAIVTVPEDLPTVTDNLIGKPWRFTFQRRLGECQAIDLRL